jgi:23S rRNA (adenine2503-C2)-methyltransferase
MRPLTRYGASRADLAEQLADEPRYRADQVWDALWRRRIPLEDATELPKGLRSRLAERLPLTLTHVASLDAADGLTSKWRFTTGDGAAVETVLMRSPRRASVCISSQAGCAMACPFCATGQAGFERHLATSEIVEQVLWAQHASPQRVTNVVYMGMGEPLANYDPVWESVTVLHDTLGLSARRVTLSTIGVVPGMRRLAAEDLPVTLAVSLHAPNDELRSQLVPLNHRYPIADVLDAAADVAGAHGRRVTFEYACIDGLNDGPRQAADLGRLLAAWPGVGGAHVNLIPLNPTPGFGGSASPGARVQAFARRLRDHGITVTVRRTRGRDIDAACGQLQRGA